MSENISNVIHQQHNLSASDTVCVSSKASFGSFSIYNTVLLCMQVVIPCLIAFILESVTLHGIKKRPNQNHWVKEIMITKQHICIAVVFIICWLPLMLTNIISDYTRIPEISFHILQPFAMSSIIYFPIIYYFLNAHIKREFLLLVQNIVTTITTHP